MSTCTSKTKYIFKDSSDNVPKNVVTVSIDPQVTIIPDLICSKCTLLTSIEIPDTVTIIGDWAFRKCSSLTSVHIPDSITCIGNGAFFGCVSLTSIAIPPSATIIGSSASLTSLKSINIPNSVSTIGNYAFSECSSLISIHIPNSVSIIGHYAFRGCSSLSSISIPPSVTKIYDGAFSKCHALQQRQINGRNCHQYISTWLRRRFDNLPLHQICYNDTSTLDTNTLNSLLQQHVSMFTSTDAMLMTPLHVLCCNPTATLEMIQLLIAAQRHTSLMRNAMNKTPLMMLLESKSKKNNAFHDQDGQLLPLVGLLEQGLDHDALEMIWTFDDKIVLFSELEKRDEVSGLLPFMYGASLSKCSLDVVYKLVMKRVDLL
jgi:hypothetical protein